jgi:hypothetical protein
MTFTESISNDAVTALPAVQFDGEIVVVESPQALTEACAHLSKQAIL